MSVQNPYRLGQTAVSGERENLLGQIGCFTDQDRTATGVFPETSMMLTYALWVKNERGSAALPGEVVIWDTGSTYGVGRATGANVTSATTAAAGVVDPFLPTAGVADNAHYWLIFRGPCKFLFTTGTTLAVGDVLLAGASGRVTKYDITSAAAQANFDRCGRALAAVDTAIASDTKFLGYADFRF